MYYFIYSCLLYTLNRYKKKNYNIQMNQLAVLSVLVMSKRLDESHGVTRSIILPTGDAAGRINFFLVLTIGTFF